MRVTKYIPALVVSGLALLLGAGLEVTAVHAEPIVVPPIEQAKKALAAKPKVKRPIKLNLQAVAPPVATQIAVPVPMPARESAAPAKKGPYLDIEGLVVGDLHVQPNLLFNTDTRYDNSTTRERAQRDDQDFMAARQHGDATRGPDPVGELIRTKILNPPTVNPNDPGYEVAVAVRDQVNVLPPKPVAAAPAAPPHHVTPKTAAQKAAAAKLAKR